MQSKTKALLISTLIVFALALAPEVKAQCAMCRAVAESGHETSEHKIGAGLNKGILYLLSVPYLLGGAAFVIWYKNKKKA